MNHCQIGLDMLREDTVMVETFFKKNYFPWKISHRYKSRESDIVNSHVPLIQLQFSSVIQSRPLLCNPMDCSTLGFPVYHQLPEIVKFMSIRLAMPSNHFILCHPHLLLSSIFPSIRVFCSKSVIRIGSQSIGDSALASVLPMNIQD